MLSAQKITTICLRGVNAPSARDSAAWDTDGKRKLRILCGVI